MRLLLVVPIGLGVAVLLSATILHHPHTGERWLGNRALLEPITSRSVTAQNVTVTDSLRTHDQSVWVDEIDRGLVIDETAVTCHGGRLHVKWHVGNLEPQSADAGIHLIARLDGEPIGAVMRGSLRGAWEDDPANLDAVVDCPAGQHIVDMLVNPTGKYGLPYVVTVGNAPDPGLPVNRGFILTEYWSVA